MISFALGESSVARGANIVDEFQRKVMAVVGPQIVALGHCLECLQSYGSQKS